MQATVSNLTRKPDVFVNVATICLTAASFLTGTHFVAEKPPNEVPTKMYATAVRIQPGVAGLQPHFVPLICKTFGFTYPKSAP